MSGGRGRHAAHAEASPSEASGTHGKGSGVWIVKRFPDEPKAKPSIKGWCRLHIGRGTWDKKGKRQSARLACAHVDCGDVEKGSSFRL
jgi:hypothetical protein